MLGTAGDVAQPGSHPARRQCALSPTDAAEPPPAARQVIVATVIAVVATGVAAAPGGAWGHAAGEKGPDTRSRGVRPLTAAGDAAVALIPRPYRRRMLGPGHAVVRRCDG